MTNTPNFNFTIAEGTDTVNLLTQLYPNFTSLDTILQAIKESGTTTAVTTKVGTVHNIVRNVADCNVIRWIATANYAAGDTFTVDGNAVTATAMDGTALPGGAFVINQSVLAILNSGVLTIVGVPGVSSVAAQDVTYDNSGSGLTATDVQNAIDEVLGDIPTGFAASAITYDNSGSGLAAANAQDAIDELAASISPGESAVIYADGSKTYRQMLDSLYAIVDWTKLRPESVFCYITSSDVGYWHIAWTKTSEYAFTRSIAYGTVYTSTFIIKPSLSEYKFTNGDWSTNIGAAGEGFKIIY